MSRPRTPEPVKLVSSLFSNDRDLLSQSITRLSDELGSIDYISEYMAFNYTDYYEKEMGSSLIRRFLTFENLVMPDTLPEIKLLTNTIEDNLSAHDRRKVNIDPGYICHAHLILATGKAYTHRPYLRNGIYADLTLVYRQHSFQPLDWTYPDYAGKNIIDICNTIRRKYLLQLKQLTIHTES